MKMATLFLLVAVAASAYSDEQWEWVESAIMHGAKGGDYDYLDTNILPGTWKVELHYLLRMDGELLSNMYFESLVLVIGPTTSDGYHKEGTGHGSSGTPFVWSAVMCVICGDAGETSYIEIHFPRSSRTWGVSQISENQLFIVELINYKPRAFGIMTRVTEEAAQGELGE